MLSLKEARSRILALAAPLEAIEIALSDAVGLVLAEPLAGDLDLPPFERAARDGYAVRADDAAAGARLRLVGPAAEPATGGGRASIRSRKPGATGRRSNPGGLGLLDDATIHELALEPGEAARVAAGAALPFGADAVVSLADGRVEPGIGSGRVVTATRTIAAGEGVVPRGEHLRAGALLARAGERIRLPMVSLLAAQGCVHPICHRRVRVAVLAVGDHLVGPGDAPVLHRERNVSGLTAVAPCLQWGATAHDLGAVAERELPAALARALTAPVVIVAGGADAAPAIRRAWRRAGVELIFSGLALEPGGSVRYGIVRPSEGRRGFDTPGPLDATHHVFHVDEGPLGLLTAVATLVGPLVARLQGSAGDVPGATGLRAVWSGAVEPPTGAVGRVAPVTLRVDDDARIRADRLEHRDHDDLAAFARAEGLALFPADAGPWREGTVVEVVPLGPWPNAG